MSDKIKNEEINAYSHEERISFLERENEALKEENLLYFNTLDSRENDIVRLRKENARLREALEYCLPQVEKMFSDIPEGLSPMFYHTLSFDGDMKQQEKLKNFRKALEKNE